MALFGIETTKREEFFFFFHLFEAIESCYLRLLETGNLSLWVCYYLPNTIS